MGTNPILGGGVLWGGTQGPLVGTEGRVQIICGEKRTDLGRTQTHVAVSSLGSYPGLFSLRAPELGEGLPFLGKLKAAKGQLLLFSH